MGKKIINEEVADALQAVLEGDQTIQDWTKVWDLYFEIQNGEIEITRSEE